MAPASRTLFLLLLGVGPAGCGDSTVPSPFAADRPDGGVEGGPSGAGGFLIGPDAGGPGSPDAATGWGGPCSEDRECTDEVACTTDRCEEGRCRFLADDAVCDDGVFCNGVEECVPSLGCRPAVPFACSDGTACTIDSCDEVTRTCVHVSRDADGDGDPDANCPSGGDCDDQDPLVSSDSSEICGNAVDDDCDGDVDEEECVTPEYDSCRDPLVVEAPGSFRLSFLAAALDGAAACLNTGPSTRDLVVAVVVPDGPPVDVDLVLRSSSGVTGMAAFSECSNAASAVACATTGSALDASRVSRLRLRQPPPGPIAVLLFSESEGEVTLDVSFEEPEPVPENETCGTAAPLLLGANVVARLAGVASDAGSACGTPFADLFYEITLEEPRDLRIYAAALDGNGVPHLSLRTSACEKDRDEITCQSREDPVLFRRAVPAGKHLLQVGASGPADVDVVVVPSPPTIAAEGEVCAGAPALVPSRGALVSFEDHEDDIAVGCLVGGLDAARTLSLGAASDVLIVAQVSGGDTAAVALAGAACSEGEGTILCRSGAETILRTSAQSVPAGEHRVVVESERGSTVGVTAFVRPSGAALLVPFSDDCDDLFEVPPGGGLVHGNTANVADDLSASCDVAGSSSPDQLLSLVLPRTQRVVLDAAGSGYATVVNVRSGGACPGREVPGGCSAGYSRDRSYVDTILPAGQHFIQVDGYADASGAWALDVFVMDP